MKSFLIGDGHKRITCPDGYIADSEEDDTTLICNPEQSDVLIRVTVITIQPKDPKRRDTGVWAVIDKARERGCQPIADEDKVIYSYREPSSEPGTFIHFHEVGVGNHLCFFSVTVDGSAESSREFLQIKTDVSAMIRSVAVRREDEQFTGDLLVSQRERIVQSRRQLCAGTGEAAWKELQAHLDRAYRERDEALARSVGLAFGELMRAEIPTLTWTCKSDEYGTGLGLDLAGTSITIFPEDMILKRFDRKEELDLANFATDTINMLEKMFREQQAGG